MGPLAIGSVAAGLAGAGATAYGAYQQDRMNAEALKYQKLLDEYNRKRQEKMDAEEQRRYVRELMSKDSSEFKDNLGYWGKMGSPAGFVG